MSKTSFTGRLLQSTILAGALAAAVAGAAVAQDSDDDVITVTGSLIQRSGNLTEVSPVTTIGSEEFDVRGAVRVEDMINTLPQAFGAQGANLANGSTGTSSLDLRGLGSQRTLTLMNGRRLPYGSINIYAPDVNFVPSALIKEVDILTGGASATYGPDAVAGVVNFKLDNEFTGFRLDTNISAYQHDNGNSAMQSLLTEFNAGNPSQYRVPKGSTIEGQSIDVTAIFGGKLDDGRGSVTGYIGYQNTDPILQDSYDYSQCALGTRNGGTEFTCAGSSTNQFANILDLGGALPTGVWARVNPTDGTFEARDFVSDTFNYNPYNHYQRPAERYTAGAFFDYDLAENVELYSEFMFMDNQTNSQIAPSGVFGYGVAGANGGINCDNPFLSAQQVDFLCTSRGLGGSDVAGEGSILILRRNVEGGNRNQDIRHTTFRGLLGLRGDIGDSPFSYDAYGMFSQVHRSEVYNNDLSISKLSKALYAVDDGFGNIVCAVNADADTANDDSACVPYDIFSPAGPSQAAIDYIVNPLNRDGVVEQQVVSGVITGSLEQYGMKMPWASDGVSVALGMEYRRDALDSNPDANYQAGDGAGQGGPTLPIDGSVDAFDFFGELYVPLVNGREGIELLATELAYRRSSYESFETDAYKVGFEYAPVSDIRFRASYQRAVRVPNIFELFTTQQIGLFDLSQGSNGLYDPCAGTNPSATFEQCARTGVTASQYGNIADNPAGQFNNLFGGNPDLEPESSDTYTIGFVAEPSAIEGLLLSVDYFDIKVDGLIDNVSEELSLRQCLETGSDFFCSLINRGAGGTLWANQTGYILATDINTGSLKTKGVDFLANYQTEVGQNDVSVDFVGTYLAELETKPLPNSGADQIFDCAGLYGGSCGASNPEWRHKMSVTVDTPMDFSVTGTWRYYDEVKVSQSSDQVALSGSFAEINETLDAQNYFDLSGNYSVTEKVSLRVGVNNILDEEPPLSSIVGTAPGNGNTYPQIYDAFGRKLFAGATIDF